MAVHASHGVERASCVGLGLGLAAVSTASIFIRYAQADGAPSLVIAAYRLVIASLILLPVVLWRRRAELRGLGRRDWLLALASGLCLGLHFGAWVSSLAYTTVTSSIVLVSTSPLFAVLFAATVLREKPSGSILAGLGLALLGASIVGAGDACAGPSCPPLAAAIRGTAFLGDGLALVGAISGGAYYSLGRVLRRTMSLTTYISLTYGTAALALLAAVLAVRLPLAGYASRAYLWFVLLALVPQLVGHSSFNWALKYLPVTYVSISVLGEPVGTILLAAVLLREVPSPLKLAGSALILAGIAVASRASIAPSARAMLARAEGEHGGGR